MMILIPLIYKSEYDTGLARGFKGGWKIPNFFPNGFFLYAYS